MNRQHAIRWFACLLVAAAGLALVWLGPSSGTPPAEGARAVAIDPAAAAAREAGPRRVAHR